MLPITLPSLLLLAVMIVNCQASIETVNQIQNAPKTTGPFIDRQDAHFTTTLCADVQAVSASDDPTILPDNRAQNGPVKFYLGPEDGDFREVENKVTDTLFPIMGLHDVIVMSNNQSFQELETALLCAWMPSIETYAGNKDAPPSLRNHTSIRILAYNSSGLLTDTGLSVIWIIYTVTIADNMREGNRHRSQERHSSAPSQSNMSATPSERIPSPAEDEFTRRLASKGVVVCADRLVPVQSIVLKGSPREHDLIDVRRNLIKKLENYQKQIYPACGTNDIDIRIHQMAHRVLLSELKLPQLDWTHATYTISANNKTYAGVKLPNFGDDYESRYNDESGYGVARFDTSYRFHERQPSILIDPDTLFRMHISLPVNHQHLETSIYRHLSGIEDAIRKSLDYSVGKVIVWDLDLSNGSLLWFAVVKSQDLTAEVVVDQRSSLGKNFYRKLEGAKVPLLDYTKYPTFCEYCRVQNVSLHRLPVLEKQNESTRERESFLLDCREGRIHYDWNRYGDCFLQETFGLYLMTHDPKERTMEPSIVLRTVQEAFTEANPLTIDSAHFNLTLISHESVLRTSNGYQGHRYNFSFTYSNLTRGKYWNVWKFPTDAIAEKFARATPSLTPFHPSFAFRLYSSVPIGHQFIPSVVAALKKEMDFAWYPLKLAEIITTKVGDNTSNAIDFFVIIEKQYVTRFAICPQTFMGKQIHNKIAKIASWNINHSVLVQQYSTDAGAIDYYEPRVRKFETPVYVPIRLSWEPLLLSTEDEYRATEECNKQAHAAIGPCVMPKTFSIFLTSHRYRESRNLDSARCLEAVGDAFIQANPETTGSAKLTIALTGQVDGFLTIRGRPVVKFDFNLTCSGMEVTESCNLWKFPTTEGLLTQLQNIGASIPSDRFY